MLVESVFELRKDVSPHKLQGHPKSGVVLDYRILKDGTFLYYCEFCDGTRKRVHQDILSMFYNIVDTDDSKILVDL